MFHQSISGEVLPPVSRPVREVAGMLRGMGTLPTLALRHGQVPRGDGGVVRVLPGYLTSDLSTIALRRYLATLGYTVHGWGLGTNRGDVGASVRSLLPVIRQDAQTSGAPVRLVGWSLGGVVARELAKADPRLVRHVVTLGSPVVGGPKYTLAAASYRAQGLDVEAIADQVAARNAAAMPVPVTAIYSKGDGVVAWQACLDPHPDSPVEHIEVRGSHAELGFSPPVLRLVATALARPVPAG
jgi:pimeloyl-ACP methyl ester carboxylesterase